MKTKVPYFSFFYLPLSFSILISLMLFMPHLSLCQPNFNILPFQLRENLILIQAEIDGKTGYFIIDTGIRDVALNKACFSGAPSDKVFYSITGQAMPLEEKIVQLKLGTWSINAVEAVITDFQNIEIKVGLPVFGTLGSKLFDDCELVLDFIFQELTIYHLNHKGQRKESRSIHNDPVESLQFRYKGLIPSIEAKVGDRTFRLGLDTGAGINLLSERVQDEVSNNLLDMESKVLAGFGLQADNLPSVMLTGLILGQVECPPMQTIFGSLDRINRSLPGKNLDGLLGKEFLTNFRTAINFKTRVIHLWDKEMVEQQWLVNRN